MSTLNRSSIYSTSRSSLCQQSISQMGIHQRIVQINYYVCRQLAMEFLVTPTDLDILQGTLFAWSLKIRFLSNVTPRNLTVETFVRIDSWILISNAFFLVGDYYIWSFTNVQRKSVRLEPVINSCQFPVHSALNIVNVSVGCKNWCIVSKMNKTHLVWDPCMSLI